jgi:hypothetical protein
LTCIQQLGLCILHRWRMSAHSTLACSLVVLYTRPTVHCCMYCHCEPQEQYVRWQPSCLRVC